MLDPSAVAGPLRGRVVDGRGRPVAGVRLFRAAQVLDVEHAGEHIWGEQRTVGGPLTRGDGTFEVEDLARDGAHLRLEGDGIVPRTWGLDPGQPLAGEVEIEVELRAYLRVNAGPDEVGAELAVLDGEGRELEVLRWRGPGGSGPAARPWARSRAARAAPPCSSPATRPGSSCGPPARSRGASPCSWTGASSWTCTSSYS